jgi:hypothetical protein
MRDHDRDLDRVRAFQCVTVTGHGHGVFMCWRDSPGRGLSAREVEGALDAVVPVIAAVLALSRQCDL